MHKCKKLTTLAEEKQDAIRYAAVADLQFDDQLIEVPYDSGSSFRAVCAPPVRCRQLTESMARADYRGGRQRIDHARALIVAALVRSSDNVRCCVSAAWSDAASRRYRSASVSAPTRRRRSRVDFIDAAAAAFCPSAVGSVPSVEETNLFRSISHRPIPTRDLAHGWRSRLGVTARCRNALRAAQVNVNSPQPLFDYKSDVGAVRWWLTACLTSDDVRAHQILCVTRGELHALEEDVRWERIELQR